MGGKGVIHMTLSDIEKLTKENTFFRKVIFTGDHSQLVLMSIPVGEEIGEEVHAGIDQLLFIVEGDAEAILDGEVIHAPDEGVVIVPGGVRHNIKNIGDEELKLYTVYAPPEHPEGTVHKTKEEAALAEY